MNGMIKDHEPLLITDCKKKHIEASKDHKYLGSYVNAREGSEDDVKHRITAAWQIWEGFSRSVCGRKMPV
jgi:hypothetical protein